MNYKLQMPFRMPKSATATAQTIISAVAVESKISTFRLRAFVKKITAIKRWG